jgi:hypothetical protein
MTTKITGGWINSRKEFKEIFKQNGLNNMTKLYLDDSDERPLTVREDVLSEIWSANKKVVDGHWYVRLSEVAEIVSGEPTPNDFFDEGC